MYIALKSFSGILIRNRFIEGVTFKFFTSEFLHIFYHEKVCVGGVTKIELQVKYLYQEPFSPELNWIWKVSDKGKLFQIFNFTIYLQNCLILISTIRWSG